MATTAESLWQDQSAFHYDYETLRTTGVILAVIMFVAGILIALSKKIKCSKSSNTTPVESHKFSTTEVSQATV